MSGLLWIQTIDILMVFMKEGFFENVSYEKIKIYGYVCQYAKSERSYMSAQFSRIGPGYELLVLLAYA